MSTPVVRMKRRKAVDIACGLGLTSLALMAYSVLSPRPIPVFLAMTVGQVIGTISFGMFLFIVALDLRRARIFSNDLKATRTSGPSAVADGPREGLN